jgi:hypothetical protein
LHTTQRFYCTACAIDEFDHSRAETLPHSTFILCLADLGLMISE